MFRLIQDIRQLDGIKGCYGFGDFLHVRFAPGSWQIAELENTLKSKHTGLALSPITPGIEDCFMALMESHA
jgi:hypothetical protein